MVTISARAVLPVRACAACMSCNLQTSKRSRKLGLF